MVFKSSFSTDCTQVVKTEMVEVCGWMSGSYIDFALVFGHTVITHVGRIWYAESSEAGQIR